MQSCEDSLFVGGGFLHIRPIVKDEDIILLKGERHNAIIDRGKMKEMVGMPFFGYVDSVHFKIIETNSPCTHSKLTSILTFS